jgi:hypothetical protein
VADDLHGITWRAASAISPARKPLSSCGWRLAAGGLGGGPRVGWLRGSAAQRWAERVTGVVLIGFGLRLAAETR